MPSENNELETIVTDRLVEDINNSILQFIRNTENTHISDESRLIINNEQYFQEPTRDEIKYIQFRTTKCKLSIVENERKEWFNQIIEEKIKNM